MENPSLNLDILVIGSGVAGLSTTVYLSTSEKLKGVKVGVLTKNALDESTTRWAQGGIAAVIGSDEDSVDSHMADTIKAGAGLCDIDAVRVLVNEGPSRVESLIALGAVFDKNARGEFTKELEGGHSRARVLHANGLATGQEVERALVEAVRETATATFEGFFIYDLLVKDNKAYGVRAYDQLGISFEIFAEHIILATGGAGQLYSVTTNPNEVTGDGIALALLKGALVCDLEFVQFHPSALYHPGIPKPLLSEALRGHGAKIRNEKGERFVNELKPRDVVSKAIAKEISKQEKQYVFLDATEIEDFEIRFPTIYSSLSEVGLDPAKDWLPVAPAAHYFCGGILTDLDGATSIANLWAVGETACSGVHGANRLASNSLLEGMVLGARCAEAVLKGKTKYEFTGTMRALSPDKDAIPGEILGIKYETVASGKLEPKYSREKLQETMTSNVGILRVREKLESADKELDSIFLETSASNSREFLEFRNLYVIAKALTKSATKREETRGAHVREDFPEKNDKKFLKRYIFSNEI